VSELRLIHLAPKPTLRPREIEVCAKAAVHKPEKPAAAAALKARPDWGKHRSALWRDSYHAIASELTVPRIK